LNLYAPDPARWKTDLSYINEHFPMRADRFYLDLFFDYREAIDILVTAKDGGNIFRRDIMDAIISINDYIVNEMSVAYNISGQTGELKYVDLCMAGSDGCFVNDHLKILTRLEETVIAELKKDKKIETALSKDAELAQEAVEHFRREFVLTYPIGYRGRTPINFGLLVSGVEINKTDQTIISAQATRINYDLRHDIVPFGKGTIRYKEYRLEDVFYNFVLVFHIFLRNDFEIYQQKQLVTDFHL
jgi:hypothetical protein